MSQPRSGTHMLEECLKQHIQIASVDEVFRPGSRGVIGNTAFERLNFINNNFKNITGFIQHDDIIHYGYPPNSHDALYDFKPKPLLIWLSRMDKISQYVSYMIALRNKQWMITKEHERKKIPPSFTIDIPNFISWANSQKSNRLTLLEKFKNWDSLNFLYEQCETNMQNICDIIFDKLDVEKIEVNKTTLKQRTYNITNYVINYWDVYKESIRQNIIPMLI